MEEEASGSESMFSISPMGQKLILEPGEVREGTIKVFTPADLEGKFMYRIEVAPYNVEGADYEADLSTQSARSQIVDWIKIEEPAGVLEANETKEIRYTITVPENAAGGGQYAAILVGSDEKNAMSGDGVNIKNIYQMASVIYARVNGETKRGGEISLNKIPGFITSSPMEVSVELTNDGNIHETAKIQLSVKNFLNGSVVYPGEGDDGVIEEVIMPETTRVAARDINEMPALGVFEVTQTVDYLGEHSSVTQLVVACPIWFMVMVGIVVALIIGGIVMAVKKHREKRVLV